jgi:hypothetical protein
MILAALLLQSTSVSTAPPPSFSILADPCATVTRDGKEVVVCGRDSAASQRLPYPKEIIPNGPVASNPYLTGAGALASTGAPCAAQQSGCQVGFGPFPLILTGIVEGVRAAKDAAKDRRWAKARARDGTRRQAIDLGATSPAGRLEP